MDIRKYRTSNREILFLVVVVIITGLLAFFLANNKSMSKKTEQEEVKIFLRPEIKKKEQEKDTSRIIIMIDIPYQTEGKLPHDQAVQDQRQRILKAQDDLLAKLEGYNYDVIAKFRYMPSIGLRVDNETLEYLRTLPEVKSISDDSILEPLY